MHNSTKLLQVASQFAKLADFSMSQDTGLTDALRKAFGPTMSQMAANVFATEPCWSLQIGISYKKPTASFTVLAMCADKKEEIEQKLKAALDQKFAAKAGQMISSKAKEEAFDISNFLTYEKQ